MKTDPSPIETAPPAKWNLKIGDKIHGPYTANQMRSLVGQGMVAPHSLIAPAGSDDWCGAAQDAVISGFFRKKSGTAPSPPERKSRKTPSPVAGQDEQTNFVLITDIKSENYNDLEQAILSLGRARHIMKNVWVLRSRYSAGTVRNALVQYMGSMDSLFVVDADHGKTAWFNLGLETDAKIRDVWQKSEE